MPWCRRVLLGVDAEAEGGSCPPSQSPRMRTTKKPATSRQPMTIRDSQTRGCSQMTPSGCSGWASAVDPSTGGVSPGEDSGSVMSYLRCRPTRRGKSSGCRRPSGRRAGSAVKGTATYVDSVPPPRSDAPGPYGRSGSADGVSRSPVRTGPSRPGVTGPAASLATVWGPLPGVPWPGPGPSGGVLGPTAQQAQGDVGVDAVPGHQDAPRQIDVLPADPGSGDVAPRESRAWEQGLGHVDDEAPPRHHAAVVTRAAVGHDGRAVFPPLAAGRSDLRRRDHRHGRHA